VPHAAEAHLAEKVEIVFVEQHELRAQQVELALEARQVFGSMASKNETSWPARRNIDATCSVASGG
jgi:hypothetical protein